jgi:LacI family transcriptional regulator
MEQDDACQGSPERPLKGRLSLKQFASLIGLSPTTVSLVLNDSPAGKSIPPVTRERIIAAAREHKYQPSHVARALRARRSHLVGVLVPEISEGYSSLVLAGIDEGLRDAGYAYLVTSHRHETESIRRYGGLLRQRQVEGFILVATPLVGEAPFVEPWPLPMLTVSGHERREGLTNIVLDHNLAARLALCHLKSLGHSRIAFIKGQAFSSDTGVRWAAIERAAAAHGIATPASRIGQLEGDSPSPLPGYRATQALLAKEPGFSALFAFNDISAIGAIRALREAGRRVPQDVSVVGFDDIVGAAFHNPALTTIRQPLQRMGRLAAEALRERIEVKQATEWPPELVVEPELVVRESTGPAR